MTDIKVCTENNSGVSSDIIVCDQSSPNKPQDIKVCENDGRLDDCSKYSTVTISGAVDCSVGEIYTASGGSGDYTYSFDTGTIDQDGEIDSYENA